MTSRALTSSEQSSMFDKIFAQQRAEEKRPNILVCGYTGSGKSSLIKTILGDIVPDNKIGSGRPQTMNYDRFENRDVVLYDSKGLELGETEDQFMATTRAFIRQRQNDPNVDHHIHLVWYAVQGPGARVTECDLALN